MIVLIDFKTCFCAKNSAIIGRIRVVYNLKNNKVSVIIAPKGAIFTAKNIKLIQRLRVFISPAICCYKKQHVITARLQKQTP